MYPLRAIVLIALGALVSACTTVDVPTRNSAFETLPDGAVAVPDGYTSAKETRAAISDTVVSRKRVDAVAADLAVSGESPVSVNSVTVRVPRSLKVSERNSYLPLGDIVWREDPIGDRHAQVQKIVQDALVRGVAPLSGPVDVDVDVQVQRFHALTEKARYTTGGVHAITFDLALRDPATGKLLVPARRVRADLDAFGGQQAINAEARGQTQKVRITDHLAEVIRQELTSPDGYKNANLGFYQLLNQI